MNTIKFNVKAIGVNLLQGLVIFGLLLTLWKYLNPRGWEDVVEDIAWCLTGSDPNSWWALAHMFTTIVVAAVIVKFVFLTRWYKK